MLGVEELKQDYSSLAPAYEEKRFSGHSGQFLYATDRRIVREAVALAAPTSILDVPTGTGRVLDYLRDHKGPITGVDATPEMLAQANRYARPGKDTLLLGNATALPFDSGSFDFLVSLRFFHLFDEQARLPFATEFRRLLRPGGHLLLSMTNGWYAGGLNWMKNRMGRQTVQFEHQGEIGRLFPGWKVVSLSGNFLPFQAALSSVPAVGASLSWLTGHFPLNRVCYERYYLLRKP